MSIGIFELMEHKSMSFVFPRKRQNGRECRMVTPDIRTDTYAHGVV